MSAKIGRLSGASFIAPIDRENDPDAPIRATDSDASHARLSAARKKYLDDPFAALFVSHASPFRPLPPLINIGTYIRSHTIDVLVNNFVSLARSHGLKSQIISFGAGSDTRFWRLAVGSAPCSRE